MIKAVDAQGKVHIYATIAEAARALDMMKELVCLRENFPQVPMNELFIWASLNGARFLGKEDVLGSISVGKRPGIVHVSGIDEGGCITSESCTRRII